LPNPLGKNAGSVWWITAIQWTWWSRIISRRIADTLYQVSCPENGVVLDMFGGTATTALAALKLGHSAIYIDINPDYAKNAEARIRRELA